MHCYTDCMHRAHNNSNGKLSSQTKGFVHSTPGMASHYCLQLDKVFEIGH